MALFRTADLDALAGAPFTYPDIGATREDLLPQGYAHLQRTEVVGEGERAFRRAVDAVFEWRMQRGIGLRVRAAGSPREPGTVVVLTAGLPSLGYDIPCRVVWAQSEGEEQGFGYGTLPGHPESGEECFVVRIDEHDQVHFTTRVFSRLATPLARAGGPASRRVQRTAVEGYVRAIRRAAHAGEDAGRPPSSGRAASVHDAVPQHRLLGLLRHAGRPHPPGPGPL